MTEQETRALLVELAASLFARGYSVGSAGNISVRVEGGYLMTPTNSSLGRLDPARLSKLDPRFEHTGGDKPSKEVFMHRAMYEARPDAGAVVHLHSTMATAIAFGTNERVASWICVIDWNTLIAKPTTSAVTSSGAASSPASSSVWRARSMTWFCVMAAPRSRSSARAR